MAAEILNFILMGMFLLAGLSLLMFLKAKAQGSAGVEVPHETPAPNVPPIVPIVPIDSLIHTAAAQYGQDPLLMKAVIRQESNFDPGAINPKDPSYGLGQIMPFWVWYFGLCRSGDLATAINLLMNARANVDVQARILDYFRRRGFQFPRDIDVYNVGETQWAKGIRNHSYRESVLRFYRGYGGLA